MPLIPIREAATRLGVTPQAVRDLIRSGRLDALQIGRAYVVEADDLTRIRPATKPRGRPRKEPKPE